MTKRFTATEKWDDPWFHSLDDKHRQAWLFLLDKCNHAGIWNVNMPLMEFHLGAKPKIEAFGGKVVAIGQEKWFIPKFIDFQYGTLNPENRAHASVLSILEKEGAYKVLGRSLQGRKDKDKDKDKGRGSGGNQTFELFYKAYPRKVAPAKAREKWEALNPGPELLEKILKAVERQKQQPQWLKDDGNYIPHPTTWLNQKRWEDQPNDSNGQRPKVVI